MMTRPLLLRLAPRPLRIPLYYRFYRVGASARVGLYEAASLAAAPAISMRLQPGDEMHDCIAHTGLYETELTERISQHAKRGGLLVDVGANFGYFSLLWAGASPQNRVIAFEASPRNLPGLKHNISANGFDQRIRLEPCAAGKANGEMAFDPGPPDQTGWGGVAAQESDGMIHVPARRLDEALAGEARIDVLKIDVEGAESWVLEGAEKLLHEKRVRRIYFEANKPRLAALGMAEDVSHVLLRSMGYEITPVGDPTGEVAEFCAMPRAS